MGGALADHPIHYLTCVTVPRSSLKNNSKLLNLVFFEDIESVLPSDINILCYVYFLFYPIFKSPFMYTFVFVGK